MSIVKMHQAKSQLSRLVARAEAGEEIILARGDKPVVRLVPVTAPDKRGQMTGFGEGKQDEYDLSALRQAVETGREMTIMRDGKAVAKVVPVGEKKPRVPGRFAHLRGKIPDSLFFDPLPEEELAAWEGAYSRDPSPNIIDVGDHGPGDPEKIQSEKPE